MFPDEDLSEDEREWDDFGCALGPNEFVKSSEPACKDVVRSGTLPLLSDLLRDACIFPGMCN